MSAPLIMEAVLKIVSILLVAITVLAMLAILCLVMGKRAMIIMNAAITMEDATKFVLTQLGASAVHVTLATHYLAMEETAMI